MCTKLDSKLTKRHDAPYLSLRPHLSIPRSPNDRACNRQAATPISKQAPPGRRRRWHLLSVHHVLQGAPARKQIATVPYLSQLKHDLETQRACKTHFVAVLAHFLVPHPVPGTKGMTRNVYMLVLDTVPTLLLLPGPSHFLGKSPIQVLGLGTELWRVNPMYACLSVCKDICACMYLCRSGHVYARSFGCMYACVMPQHVGRYST